MKPSLLLAVALLAGCATSVHQQGLDKMRAGDAAGAIPLLEQAVQQGDNRAYFNLAIAYAKLGDEPKALSMLNMAARWGDPNAQQFLASKGLPVPSADLASQAAHAKAARDASNAAGTAATLQIMNSLNPAPAIPTNCRTVRIGNSLETQCF